MEKTCGQQSTMESALANNGAEQQGLCTPCSKRFKQRARHMENNEVTLGLTIERPVRRLARTQNIIRSVTGREGGIKTREGDRETDREREILRSGYNQFKTRTKETARKLMQRLVSNTISAFNSTSNQKLTMSKIILAYISAQTQIRRIN